MYYIYIYRASFMLHFKFALVLCLYDEKGQRHLKAFISNLNIWKWSQLNMFLTASGGQAYHEQDRNFGRLVLPNSDSLT